MKKLFILILLLGFNISYATVTPTPSSKDQRLQTVTYQPDEIVHIDTFEGYATAIVLHRNETVDAAAIGDAEAWEVSVSQNAIFIKPLKEQPRTNLHVATNLRTYVFTIDVITDESLKDTVPYRVTFKYPKYEKELLRQELESKRKSQKDKPITFKSNFDPLTHLYENKEIVNTQYKGRGDKLLKPRHIYDDGKQTYILFSENQLRPAIYSITKGKESLINRVDKNNWVIIQGVYSGLMFRGQDYVYELKNTKYAPEKDNRKSKTSQNPFKLLIEKSKSNKK